MARKDIVVHFNFYVFRLQVEENQSVRGIGINPLCMVQYSDCNYE